MHAEQFLSFSRNPHSGSLPTVLGRLLGGSLWVLLRTVLQAVFAFWSVPLILQSIGKDAAGAYAFAEGFGFLKLLLEFGMGSAFSVRPLRHRLYMTAPASIEPSQRE